MTAGRRAAGALSPRGSVGGSGASKMRRALRGILFTLLRRRSGLRVKKRTRVGGRQSVRVITVPSASAAPETRAAADDRDHDLDALIASNRAWAKFAREEHPVRAPACRVHTAA